jgi:hypothetical protein
MTYYPGFWFGILLKDTEVKVQNGTVVVRFYQILEASDFKYGRQVAILENQLRVITPELIAGSAPNYNHRYI